MGVGRRGGGGGRGFGFGRALRVLGGGSGGIVGGASAVGTCVVVVVVVVVGERLRLWVFAWSGGDCRMRLGGWGLWLWWR